MRLAAGPGIAVVVLAVVVLVGACGSSPPSDASPLTTSPVAGSPAPVRVDATLLERLPNPVDGVSAQPDPETAAEIALDATLQVDVQAIAIAIYVAPESSGSTGDYAVVTVVQLRPGIFGEAFYRDWRDTFDMGVCEQAGGVSTRAETTIAERNVHIGTCAGGVRTYHVHLPADDLIVSIQGVGEQRLGERIVAGLTE